MRSQIHWHEGLFLQPHHLQRFQKNLVEMIQEQRRLGWPYPYGVVEARLSHDELENMRLRFDRLRAIMPSGLEVNFPANAELASLDIKQAFAKGTGSFGVLLGVPLWLESRANTVDPSQGGDSRAKLLYRVGEAECADENTGANPKPVQMRMINARLLLEHEDTSDMEVLPLLRIVRSTGEDGGRPREDAEFVPPCLVVSGSPKLREFLRDLVAQVEASRKELVIQVSRGGFSIDTMRGAQFEQVMRLRTLNRFSARLPSLVLAPGITPFTLYLEFRELLADLAALHPDRDEFECGPYDHDNPLLCFSELSTKIRAHLRGAVAPSFMKVVFEEAEGLLTAPLTDQQLSVPNAYFLGVRTKQDPTAVARFVEDGDKFKLMPKSMARSAIRGIEIKEERHAPLELPAASDLHYFRLDRTASARRWEQVQNEKSLVVIMTGGSQSDESINWAETSFTLYMTVPNAS